MPNPSPPPPPHTLHAVYPPTQPAPAPSSSSTPKISNVFTNDGSFLERFRRTKKEEEEKKKSEEALTRKRDFDNRFKNRGKRPPPDSSDNSTAIAEDIPTKRHKFDKPLTDYEEQVRNYAGHGLKDNGTGVRPLVK